MILRVSNLISCELCARYKENICTSTNEFVTDLFRTCNKQSAHDCPEFTNERVPISGEIALEKALKFMLAGCSEFILLSVKTGRRLNYKLDKKISNSKKDEYIYWLNTGEKNGTYTYAGVLYFDSNDNNFKFGKGARGKLTADDIRVKSLLFVLNQLMKAKFNMDLKVFHVGKCGKCGKKLTDPTSILTGLGPVCAKQSGVPMVKYTKTK